MTAEPGTFRSQVVKSGKLLSVRFASNIGLRLVSTVVLSRLLAPEVYGIFAVVLVYIYLLEMISDFGIRSLILTREDEVSHRFLRTCWTVSILRGAFICMLSILLGVGFSLIQKAGGFDETSSYAATQLPYAIAGLGIVTLIFGFESPHRFMSERAMAFERVTVVDVSRNIITLIVTIGLAVYLRSVWALVFGQMVRSVVHVGLSFALFSGPRLALSLDRDSLKILVDRGKWVLGQSMLTAVSQSFDRIFLALVMSSSTFGFYYIARQLTDMVPQFLNALNGSLLLQVFRKLHQQDPAQFRRNYYRYRLILDSLSGLTAGGLVVVAPLLVEIVFDDRYAGVAPIMQILVLSMLLTGMMILCTAFNAILRFDIATKLSVVSVVSLVAGLSYTTLVIGSAELALFVVALHRIPEAVLVTILGWRRGWVVLWRETLIFGTFGIGALLGWGVLWIWATLR